MCYVDQVSYDPDFSGANDGTEPWMWPGFYNPIFATTPMPFININSGKYSSVVGLNTIVNDTDEEQPVAAYMYTMPGQSSNVDITLYGVELMKAA